MLSCTDTAAFTLNHNIRDQDLAQEESSLVEVINTNVTKSDVKENLSESNLSKTNDVGKNNSGNVPNDSYRSIVINLPSPLDNVSTERLIMTTTQVMGDQGLDSIAVSTDNYSEKSTFGGPSVTEVLLTNPTSERSADMNSQLQTDIYLKTTLKSVDSELTTSELPQWKKYTTIDRKRSSTTSDEVTETNTNEMTKAESKDSSVSLRDIVTSDIPSLEKLKNDLLTSTPEQKTENNYDTNTEEIKTSKLDTVESIRGGYLDMSSKNTFGELLTATESYEMNINPQGKLRAMFDTETDIPEEKIGSKFASQSQSVSNGRELFCYLIL